MLDRNCVIIGAGAAGLMCAAAAAHRGRRVMVLEHANKVGKKILMSGGGRCNFTNLGVGPDNFLSGNPHFCKSALARFSQWDFITLAERHGLEYHEKTLGQLFCNHKSREVLNLLLHECDEAGVDIHTHCDVKSIETIERDGYRYRLQTDLGEVRCQSLVVATGGLSIPKMGASGFGYEVARQFGLEVGTRSAALVPFTFKGALLALAQSLAGVSLPVITECRGQSFSEALLFTHKGISGPAVLQVSNYWHSGDCVQVDFLPGVDLVAVLSNRRDQGSVASMNRHLCEWLPRRFVRGWLEHHGWSRMAEKRLADVSNHDITSLADLFKRWTCIPAGTEGYRTAEVTRGGVDTSGVSSKTFEAKHQPGLYFIGEVLDVTGWLGGYNFQWAWASGYCAGQFV